MQYIFVKKATQDTLENQKYKADAKMFWVMPLSQFDWLLNNKNIRK